jgi:hypothetical protein
LPTRIEELLIVAILLLVHFVELEERVEKLPRDLIPKILKHLVGGWKTTIVDSGSAYRIADEFEIESGKFIPANTFRICLATRTAEPNGRRRAHEVIQEVV